MRLISTPLYILWVLNYHVIMQAMSKTTVAESRIRFQGWPDNQILIQGTNDGPERGMNDTEKVLNIAFMIPWSGDWPIGPSVASAFLIGLFKVIDLDILPGFHFDWDFEDTECSGLVGTKVRNSYF